MNNSLYIDKINIITGGFGSGKSEYSINLAISLTNDSSKVTLVDLDLVNAYFRSREAIDIFAKHGIKAIIPPQEVVYSDLPIAGPGIRDLIINQDGTTIFDVGGDDMGSLALAPYQQEFARVEKNVLMIINPFRPFTSNLKQIIAMKNDIEINSGLLITGLVSNPNLGAGTKTSLILEKHLIVERVAQELGVPLIEMAVHSEIYRKEPNAFDDLKIPIRPINIFLSPSWFIKQQKEAYEEH